MKKRYWWKELNESNTLFHFAWHQTSRRHKYEYLEKSPLKTSKMVNHFEYHHEITTKSGLIRNLASHCEQLRMNVFDYTPVTFLIDVDDKTFESDLQDFLKCFCKFLPSSEDTTKAVTKFLSSFRFNQSDRSPIKSSTYTTKVHVNSKNWRIYDTFYRGSNMWLLKPVDYNRGRGIEIFNNLDTFKNLLLNGPINNPVQNGPKLKRFVVQKYIESPLLIKNRKFDIRVWVLIDHEMNLYFFKEGYLRLSSEEYSINDNAKDNLYVHLTNNAIQKNSSKYGQFESGNQLSFRDFEKNIQSDNPKASMRKSLIPKMKELIKLSMSSVANKINPNRHKYCFEIFGFDFMIDTDFNLWLIEINCNPCLEESSKLLRVLIPRMIDDAFKLTIDIIFPLTPKMIRPDEAKKNSYHYKVHGYGEQENMWDLLTNLSQGKQTLRK